MPFIFIFMRGSYQSPAREKVQPVSILYIVAPRPVYIGASFDPGKTRHYMQQRELTIMNRLGLHARAAVKLVSLSSKYVSRVVIVANGRRADARHLIAILLLSANMGARVSIETSGPDEVQAMTAVTRLISNGFGEA
jgi:phosphocarrier protein